MNTIKFMAAAKTNVGKVRHNNEDNLYFDGVYLDENNRDIPQSYTKESGEEPVIFGVFDGMGGESLGEVASLIAAQTTAELKADFAGDVNNAVSKVVKTANKRICSKITENNVDRIGTTFAMVCIKDDIARVYNIGDSRVYIMRNGQFKQVSVDDTAVQRLIDLGMITRDEAKKHIDRHKITQFLGIFSDELVIEEHRSGKIMIEKGDRILLCSDGLTDMLEDLEIESILGGDNSVEEISQELVNNALDRGGRDNTTVIVIEATTGSLHRAKEKRMNAIKSFFAAVIILAVIISGVFLVKGTIDKKITKDTAQALIVKCENMSWSTVIDKIKIGDNGTLLVGVEPYNATGKVKFQSSDPDVISVDELSGNYIAKKEGKAVISASLDDVNIELIVIVER